MNEEEMKRQIDYIIEEVTQGEDYTLRYYDIQCIMRLLDLYEQEKEKNKDIEEKLKISIAIITKGMYPEQNEGDNDFDNHFIRKEKIKEKIDELKCKERTSKLEMGNLYRYGIAILHSVLEEK